MILTHRCFLRNGLWRCESASVPSVAQVSCEDLVNSRVQMHKVNHAIACHEILPCTVCESLPPASAVPCATIQNQNHRISIPPFFLARLLSQSYRSGSQPVMPAEASLFSLLKATCCWCYIAPLSVNFNQWKVLYLYIDHEVNPVCPPTTTIRKSFNNIDIRLAVMRSPESDKVKTRNPTRHVLGVPMGPTQLETVYAACTWNTKNKEN